MPSGGRPSLSGIGGLRLKIGLLGYRRRDVEAALGARDAELVALREELSRSRERAAELDQVASFLAQRVVERDRELRRLRGELESLYAESGRIAEALREAVAAMAAERPAAAAPEPAAEGGEAGAEGGEAGAEDGGAGGEEPEAGRAPAAAAVAGAERPTGANGRREGAGAELFDGLVEVEVGPLSDFSQLVGFEDAAGAIEGASEIAIKRFARGRATLTLRLREPVALLRELEERAPFEFRIRDQRANRLVLDVAR